jgi:hypothetical protein
MTSTVFQATALLQTPVFAHRNEPLLETNCGLTRPQV